MSLIETYNNYTMVHFHPSRKDNRSRGQRAGMYTALAIIKASKDAYSAIACIESLQDCLYLEMCETDDPNNYNRGIYDEYELAIKIIRQWIEQNQ